MTQFRSPYDKNLRYNEFADEIIHNFYKMTGTDFWKWLFSQKNINIREINMLLFDEISTQCLAQILNLKE